MYRERNEAQELGIKDPIDSLKKFMVQFNVASEEEFTEIDSAVEAQISDAVQFAEDSPAPGMDAVHTNVYA